MSAGPPRQPVVVVDYGAGNIRSVSRALEAAGETPLLTNDPATVERAPAIVLPGVGSSKDAMRMLRALDLVQPLRDFAASGRPFLGVCVGLQLLFDSSEEGGGTDCLAILPGVVRRFRPEATHAVKVPHMGWNTVRLARSHPLLAGIPDQSHFYFVHSYYAVPRDPAATIGVTRHGLDFAAIVARDNVIATQFHPEKSADLGLRLYRNFASSVRGTSLVSAHSGH